MISMDIERRQRVTEQIKLFEEQVQSLQVFASRVLRHYNKTLPKSFANNLIMNNIYSYSIRFKSDDGAFQDFILQLRT